MSEKTYTNPDELMAEILRAIYAAIESKLYLIGAVIDRDAKRGMLEANQYGDKYIYDKGDFYNNASYIVTEDKDGFTLNVGSKVKGKNNKDYAPYVLGGKVPSWTPIKPLISWVERKGLSWTDKKTGMHLKVEQMAYMIRAKILREGIEPRNIYETVLQNRESWIYEQLNGIEVRV